MRRSQRKIVAWLVLTVVSLSPLLGMFAVDAEQSPAIADCQAVMAAGAPMDTVHHGGTAPTMDCAQQHNACISYCQFTSLQPTDPLRMPGKRLLWFVPSGAPDNLTTRFPDGLERPPRV